MQSASVGVNGSAPSIYSFGSGATVTYLVGSQSIRVVTDASSRTFGQSNIENGDFANDILFALTDADTGESFGLFLARPTIDYVPLTYTRLGTYHHDDASGSPLDIQNFVFGVVTDGADVPTTGSAAYSTSFGAAIVDNSDKASPPIYIANNTTGSATFTADFLAGSVSTAIDLNNAEHFAGAASVKSFGILTGSGLIQASSPAFDGTLTGSDVSGEFHGAFFGPQAAEMGMVFRAKGADLSISGSLEGRKN